MSTLPAMPKARKKAVLDVHRGYQRLVDGANGARREQPALGGVEPRAAGNGLRVEVGLPQPGVAVHEQRGPVGKSGSSTLSRKRSTRSWMGKEVSCVGSAK
ncbi:MAG: hypothetical protein HGB15_05445 [Chlorobaculum sp.]|nr:hypothetical protein [Chlorobaculum sp.]